MKAPAEKTPDTQRQAAFHEASQQQVSAEAEYEFVDNRAETIDLRQLQEMADNSPQAQGLAQLSAIMNNSPRSAAMQHLQVMADNSPRQVAQRQLHREAKPNNTGLPDNLKSGIESLSGMSLDNVKVHYNSSEPAQLNAHAYAQGTDIHVGPGQEQHLPHEAWHVVQQAQGRVKPTMQMKDGVEVNDDRGLEREADLMGAKAVSSEVTRKTELTGKTISSAQGSQALQKLTMTKNNDLEDEKELFKRRYEEDDHKSGAHNYAFIDEEPDQWAKSSGAGHAETKLAGLYASDKEDLDIVSELKPCGPCQGYLPEVEEARNMNITVYYHLSHVDTGAGNKEAIQSMYQEREWLTDDEELTIELTDKGSEIVGEADAMHEEESSSSE